MAALRIETLRPGLEEAFLRLHDERNGAGWCRCAAWWVPSWDGWGERTAAENAALRCALHARGEHDGLLAFAGDDPIGWIQLGQRDRLEKLVDQLGLERDPAIWAVTCFLVAPSHRRSGVAAALLDAAVDAARAAGAVRLEGYPRRGDALEADDAWTGTESLFTRAGFERIGDGEPRAVFSLTL